MMFPRIIAFSSGLMGTATTIALLSGSVSLQFRHHLFVTLFLK